MKRVAWGEWIMAIVFLAIMVAAAVYALGVGLSRSESAECDKWRQQAEEFPLWYSVEWQREQCAAHGKPLPR